MLYYYLSFFLCLLDLFQVFSYWGYVLWVFQQKSSLHCLHSGEAAPCAWAEQTLDGAVLLPVLSWSISGTGALAQVWHSSAIPALSPFLGMGSSYQRLLHWGCHFLAVLSLKMTCFFIPWENQKSLRLWVREIGQRWLLYMPDRNFQYCSYSSFSLFIQCTENFNILLCSFCEEYLLLAFVLNNSITY